MHHEHRGFLWGILAAVTSAAMGLFVKLANQMPITTLVFARFAIAIPIICVILWQKKVIIERREIPKQLVRGVAGLAALYCYYFALKHLSLVNAITIRSAAPLFIPVLAFFWMGVIITKRRLFAIAIGFLGVIILVGPDQNIFQAGSIVALLSAVFAAVALFSIRQLSKTTTTLTILTYYFTICSIITLPPMLINFKWVEDPLQWLYTFAAGLSALVFQYTITRAYTHAPATKVSTVNYLSVFFGGLLGWAIFHEIPHLTTWIGAILMVSGAIVALTDRTPPRLRKKSQR